MKILALCLLFGASLSFVDLAAMQDTKMPNSSGSCFKNPENLRVYHELLSAIANGTLSVESVMGVQEANRCALTLLASENEEKLNAITKKVIANFKERRYATYSAYSKDVEFARACLIVLSKGVHADRSGDWTTYRELYGNKLHNFALSMDGKQ